MRYLVFRSWLLLLIIEARLRAQSVQNIYEMIRGQAIRNIDPIKRIPHVAISHAVDIACVLYFKNVLCLQRSIVATILLRQCGWPALMVTGTQILLPESHAWVEVDGNVVNDKPYIAEMFLIVDKS